ncbi:hypothetical protein EZV62_002379 [Acer yangbiense]|uniref:dolichol kinase n=1 Tax=Acer yangbiense TaxID=1000413 RepID=A0A5C7IWY4_9ROSI|nr:hypothetical protein EZV62_002379 [Acer yangbiense]
MAASSSSMFNGERAVVVLFVCRVLFSLPLSLLCHGLNLAFLSLFALLLDIRADISASSPPQFNTRQGASSGILLGAVTLPTLMISKLIQLTRAYSLHQIELQELEHMTMQYWATSASCFGVLMFICIVMWRAPKATHCRGSYTVWDLISLFCIISYALTCCVSLSAISLTGLNTALKLIWVLCHGLVAVKLLQQLVNTFPSCASIGEVLLVTAGLVLYFGDMLACTIAKVSSHLISTEIISVQYGIRRSEISIIIQAKPLSALCLLDIAFERVRLSNRVTGGRAEVLSRKRLQEPKFLDLAFGAALAIFLALEIMRVLKVPTMGTKYSMLFGYWEDTLQNIFSDKVWKLWPLGQLIHQFMNAFTDHRDSDLLIVSHFSLLLGCAFPIWMSNGFNDRPLAPFAGILSLGIGDTMVSVLNVDTLVHNCICPSVLYVKVYVQASMVGYKYGVLRWSKTGKKTVEGTAAGIMSVLAACSILLPLLASTGYIVTEVSLSLSLSLCHWFSLILAVTVSGLLEAYTTQLDNAFIPLIFYSLLCL